MSRDTVIDAVAAADEADRSRIGGERGPSTLGDVQRRTSPGAKALFALVVVLVIGGMGALAYHTIGRKEAEAAAAKVKPADDAEIRNAMPGLKSPEEPVSAPAPATVPPITPEEVPTEPQADPAPAAGGTGASSAGGPPPPSPAELLRKRRLESSLRSGTASSDTAPATGDPAVDRARQAGDLSPGGSLGDGSAPSMADRLSPVRLSSAKAGNVGSMDLLLLQSAMIDCAMNVRIDSTVPGMVSCDATRDVYSTNGRTVVLDRGTRFTGRYESGIVQGQGRIFVVWQRAVTPTGVVVNLDSPGADPLGGSGFPGKVNNHFWKRFGAALLVSVFEDVGDYAVAKASKGREGDAIYLGNTSESARDNSSIILEKQINIPPTLTKRHGDRISIFVARDLDFSGIYELRRKYR